MVATDERQKEDTSPANHLDEWQIDDTEDDEGPPPSKADILDNRDEWVTEGY